MEGSHGGGLTQKNMALLQGVDLFVVQVWGNGIIWKFLMYYCIA